MNVQLLRVHHATPYKLNKQPYLFTWPALSFTKMRPKLSTLVQVNGCAPAVTYTWEGAPSPGHMHGLFLTLHFLRSFKECCTV